jgi:hypothetical protein
MEEQFMKPKRHRRTKQEMIAFRQEQERIKAEREKKRQEDFKRFEEKSKICFEKYG